ncbi:hypothetical protein N7478_005175 [Penicillium angulare]|uniref:uncharacterized protein n=1 Tax=Penicillium angulare TaxID=116970 RepID=UPI0025420931|nr:uncharacterized protein N7478_005175 [Penicillium angulare]KAJ5279803.1 hypothetical protein N7478_005175 [Penicillium angulare]
MGEQKPRRVLVVVSNKNPLWEQAWSASEDKCKAALEILKSNHLLEHVDPAGIRLLAKTNWVIRVFIVFDIANASYDPATGHLPEQNNLFRLFISVGQSKLIQQALRYRAG